MFKLFFPKTAFFLFAFCLVASAQYYEDADQNGIGTPIFEYTINKQFSSDLVTTRVILIAQIVYDDITFVKSDSGGYDAELEWLMAVYSDDDKLLFSRTVSKPVNVTNFKLTNSRQYKLTLKSEILLEPGDYNILLRTIDLTTNKTAQKRFEVNIPYAYADEVAVSDVLLLKSIIADSAGKLIDFEPIIGGNFLSREGEFYLYFTVYSKNLDVPETIHYQFKTGKNRVDFDTLTNHQLKSSITSHILKVNKSVFTDNRYSLNVEVDVDGEETKKSKNVTFFWRSVPFTSTDIDNALKQMVYILNPDSMEYFLAAELSKKQAFFKRFWQQRDPNPKTIKNELMDEYFKRVNFANDNFSGLGTEGWKTDRGRILVKFGQPDDLERHPFEMGSNPYEIWIYYAERKTFLFVDFSGFGTYRLHPDYVNIEYE